MFPKKNFTRASSCWDTISERPSTRRWGPRRRARMRTASQGIPGHPRASLTTKKKDTDVVYHKEIMDLKMDRSMISVFPCFFPHKTGQIYCGIPDAPGLDKSKIVYNVQSRVRYGTPKKCINWWILKKYCSRILGNTIYDTVFLVVSMESTPIYGWFLMEKTIKMDDNWGYPHWNSPTTVVRSSGRALPPGRWRPSLGAPESKRSWFSSSNW